MPFTSYDLRFQISGQAESICWQQKSLLFYCFSDMHLAACLPFLQSVWYFIFAQLMALAMETSEIGDAFHGFMAVFTTWPIDISKEYKKL